MSRPNPPSLHASTPSIIPGRSNKDVEWWKQWKEWGTEGMDGVEAVEEVEGVERVEGVEEMEATEEMEKGRMEEGLGPT